MNGNIIKKFALQRLAHYKEILVAEKDVPCVLHVLSDTQGETVLGFANGRPAQDLVYALRMALERYHADSVVFLSDAWAGALTSEQFNNRSPEYTPRTDPNRQEVLIVNYCTRMETGNLMQPYERSGDQIKFGDLITDPDRAEGRLTEWLTPVGPKEITFTQRRKIEPLARQLFNQLMANRRGA